MFHRFVRQPALIWLLAGCLFASQIFGLMHQYSANAHTVNDACVICAVSGSNGHALASTVAALPVVPVCATVVALLMVFSSSVRPLRARARSPPF